MQTLVLNIEYDGSAYAGWQVQPNAESVQGCIERALKNITGEKINLIAAGRTDAGVHASGMIAHAQLNKQFPARDEKIKKAINANLPKDIRINDALITNKSFHARFDAIAREYRYRLSQKESVFNNHFAACMKYPFSPNKLNEAAKLFIGKHDFTAFSKNNPDTKSYICILEKCEWIREEKNIWVLHIKADRFVYGMVRSLVGAMFDYARGKRSLADLKDALEKKERKKMSPLAPPHGLIFHRAYYPEDQEFFNDNDE